MSSGLDPNGVVVELESLEEFASYLPASPSEDAAPDVAHDLGVLRTRARQTSARLASITEKQSDIESSQEDIQSLLDELQSRVEAIEDSDVAEQFQHLESEVRDLDARIDSILE